MFALVSSQLKTEPLDLGCPPRCFAVSGHGELSDVYPRRLACLVATMTCIGWMVMTSLGIEWEPY
jgi:hypothetical protein